MATLTDTALAAATAEAAAVAAAAEAAAAAERAAATDAVKAILVTPTGAKLTLADVGLKAVDTDLAGGRVVYSDGTVPLAVVKRDNAWRVYLVRKDPTGWQRVSDQLRSLAELGRAITAAQPVTVA